MKKILLMIILLLGSVVIFGGCENKDYIVQPDHTPPSRPKGFYSITGDKTVYLRWEENDEEDFAEYRVYRAEGDARYYERIAKVKIARFDDHNVKNGTTYYYAVSAVDYHGNESDLSKEIYDTPRPEDFGMVIRDYHRFPETSGFDFSKGTVVSWDDVDADIYLDYDDNLNVYFLCAADKYTDIQDFGYTDNLDDVDVAPDTNIGWSELGWVEVILGHSYIIWTRDNHFAKLRVSEFIKSYGISFDWAYQVDEGNPELAPRPPHAENYLRVATREVSAK